MIKTKNIKNVKHTIVIKSKIIYRDVYIYLQLKIMDYCTIACK